MSQGHFSVGAFYYVLRVPLHTHQVGVNVLHWAESRHEAYRLAIDDDELFICLYVDMHRKRETHTLAALSRRYTEDQRKRWCFVSVIFFHREIEGHEEPCISTRCGRGNGRIKWYGTATVALLCSPCTLSFVRPFFVVRIHAPALGEALVAIPFILKGK